MPSQTRSIVTAALAAVFLLSSIDTVEAGGGIGDFRGVAVEPTGDVVGVDTNGDALIRFDPVANTCSVMSGASMGTGPAFVFAQGITVEASGDLLVTDLLQQAVIRVDPVSGDRTVISGSGTGAGLAFNNPFRIAVEASGDLVVTDTFNVRIARVDPVTGDRTTISDSGTGSGPNFANLLGIAVEASGDLVVTDSALNAVLRVDPVTGDRTIVSDAGTGAGPAINAPTDIQVEASGDLVVVNQAPDQILRVDPITGDRSVVSDAGTGGGPDFIQPAGIAIEATGDLVVADRGLEAIVHVDPVTGDRTLLGCDDPPTLPLIDDFSTGQGLLSLIAVADIGTGVSSTVTGPGILGGERDIFSFLQGGDDGFGHFVVVEGGNYVHHQDATVTGYSEISWDGPDGDGAVLDFTGLGGLDLTAGSPVQTAFDLAIVSADLNAQIIITVFTNGADLSSSTLNLPGGAAGETFTMKFDDFVPTTGGAGADFTNVGAIQMFVNGTGTPALEVFLDSFGTTSTCGDGVTDSGEECDDNNNDDGDGCSAVCTSEGGLPTDPFGTVSALFEFGLIPIPADFFGPGSDPFAGSVNFLPVPGEDVDTRWQRSGPIVCPGAGFPRPCDTVAVEIVQLDLVGTAPITVTFNGGQNPEQWSVSMGVNTPQAGGLDAILESPDGGIFFATLVLEPKFTFTKLSDPGVVFELVWFPIPHDSEILPWSVSTSNPAIDAPSNGNFVPLVQNDLPVEGTITDFDVFTHVITPAAAQVGNANFCADRVNIFEGLTPFSTIGATTDGPDYAGVVDCGPEGDDIVHNDIWFNHTATCNGELTITTCEELGGSADYDTALAVHDGCGTAGCPADAVLDCNEDDQVNPCGTNAGGFHSTLVVPVSAGNCYKIRVGGFSGAQSGTGELLIGCEPECLINPGFCDDGNACTDNVCDPDAAGADADGCVFPALEGEPCDDGDVCTSSDGTEGGADACDAAGVCQGAPVVCPGGGACDAETGECPIFPNLCADRIELLDGLTPFSTVGATTDGSPDPLCLNAGADNVNQDIWFNYNSPGDGTVLLTTCEELGGFADYDTRIAVYEGCTCPPDTIVGCNDDDPDNACGTGAGGFHSTLSVPVTDGTCYKVRVGGFGGASGSGALLVESDVAPGCTSFTDCADQDDDGITDDNCSFYECDGESCNQTARRFADIGGPNGACPVDGTADANDRFHALNCFSNSDTLGNQPYPCEANSPQATNADAGGAFGECCPDGVCDGNDAFHALNAFSGDNPCRCDADGGQTFVCPCPTPTDPPENPVLCPATCLGDCAPSPDSPAVGAKVVAEAELSLTADRDVVKAGDIFEVEITLESELHDLRGYQLHVVATGGDRGKLEIIDMSIEDRRDHVFAGWGDWRAFNVRRGQLLSGLNSEGIETRRGEYLATLTIRAPHNASGEFAVELLHDNTDPRHRTFLFPTAAGQKIAVTSVSPAHVTVEAARTKPNKLTAARNRK